MSVADCKKYCGKEKFGCLVVKTFDEKCYGFNLNVQDEHESALIGGSAHNLPKFQIPYLTPKNVQTC
jgi:hypothetical protein